MYKKAKVIIMKNLKNKINSYLIKNKDKLKINSKDIAKNDVFLALTGSSQHGKNYIQEAINKGAKYIIVDEKINRVISSKILYQKNIFKYLETLAIIKRKKFKGQRIAVTGSVGKTTIKEYLNFFLSIEQKTFSSKKSYNNYLGVLLTMINLDLKSFFSVFEVGTNSFNEIRKLASLILPQQVVITNINPTHLENLINTRNIAKEKSDLFNPRYNPKVKFLVLPNWNKDEKFMINKAKKYKIKKIITFGNNKSDYYIKDYTNLKKHISKVKYITPYSNFDLNTSLNFEHQFINLLIPLIFFDYNKLSREKLAKSALKVPSIERRGKISKITINKKKIKIIDESYNASPITMLNCIKYLQKINIPNHAKKIIVLGEMLELGKKSNFFHKQIIVKSFNSNIDIIVFCGEKFKKILSKIKTQNNIFYFDQEYQIYDFIFKKIQKNDIILAKGSNLSKISFFVKLLFNKQKVE